MATNKEIAHRFFDSAWNRGDLATVDELTTPDAFDHSPMGTERGPESFKHVVVGFRAAVPDVKLEILQEIVDGDKVVHQWRLTGNNTGEPFMGIPATNKPIEFNGITIVRLENGKLAERWAQMDLLGLMTQLGVVPPMGGPPPQQG